MDESAFRFFLLESGLSESTINNYLTVIRVVFRSVAEFNEEEVRAFLLTKLQTISHSGVNKYKKAISQYCKFLGIEPYACLKKLKEERKPRVLFTLAEIEAFVAIPPGGDSVECVNFGVFWLIACFTAMRPAEILALTTDCVSEDVIVVKNSKTGQGRTIPMPDRIKKEVLDYASKCTTKLLFTSPYNKTRPINHRTIVNDFYRRLKVLGITKDVKPYSFRHSWITRNVKTSLYDVQDIVGHKSAEVTRQYVHNDMDSMKYVIDHDPLNFQHLPAKEKMALLIDEIEKLVKLRKFVVSNKKTDGYRLTLTIES